MNKKRFSMLLALLVIAFSLVVCDIADTGEGIIDTGKKAADFLDQAYEALEPVVKQMAEDGLDVGKYALKLAECYAQGTSQSECKSRVWKEMYNDCLEKGNGTDYCRERY